MKKIAYHLVIASICLFSLDSVYSAVIDIKTIEVAYLFEEGKGKLAKDESHNKRNGSLEGGVKYGPGKFGQGLVYDGKDDNLIVKGYHGIGGKDPRTVLYWFKSDSAREHSWVKWGPNEVTKKYYVRAHVAGAQCWLRIENAGGNNWGDVDVCDGKWHHHAVVFPKGAKDVQDHDIYVDGKLNGKFGAANAMDTDVRIFWSSSTSAIVLRIRPPFRCVTDLPRACFQNIKLFSHCHYSMNIWCECGDVATL